MEFSLFTRVALSTDLPEYRLKAGDVATVVDSHKTAGKKGYSLEVFNAKGETMTVIVVEESQIKALRKDEVLHVRHIDNLAA
jgi:putative heme iron utilization protein